MNIDLSVIPCQEASVHSRETFVACGAPGAAVIFHQHDGRNVYVMCAGCAAHNVRNRGAAQIFPEGDFQDMLELHRKFSLPMSPVPRLLDHELFGMRSTFMLSELMEFQDAHWQRDLTKAADSLLDLVAVAKGTGVAMGLPWRAIWRHVHKANLAKKRGTGKGGFKLQLVKPPGWRSPNPLIEAELLEAGADPEEIL